MAEEAGTASLHKRAEVPALTFSCKSLVLTKINDGNMQAMTGQNVHSFEMFDEVACDAGIYTWDIVRNLVFADSAVAVLFGLDPDATVHGLPLEDYLARVHPDDRPDLAKKISDVIVADIAQQNTYRVQGKDGRYRMVAAFGRAFRDHSGSPVLYSGIVVPMAEPEEEGLRTH